MSISSPFTNYGDGMVFNWKPVWLLDAKENDESTNPISKSYLKEGEVISETYISDNGPQRQLRELVILSLDGNEILYGIHV